MNSRFIIAYLRVGCFFADFLQRQVVFGGFESPNYLFFPEMPERYNFKIGFPTYENWFGSLATTAMWWESSVITARVGVVKRLTYSKFAQWRAEIAALFSRDSLEFITLVCTKTDD